jgi:hypothetical protein
MKAAICRQHDTTSMIVPTTNITAARPVADMAFSFRILVHDEDCLH